MKQSFLKYVPRQRSRLATAAPSLNEAATGLKGPTAMVFLNMGGPSKTDDVEDFLTRLFVRPRRYHPRSCQPLIPIVTHRQMAT